MTEITVDGRVVRIRGEYSSSDEDSSADDQSPRSRAADVPAVAWAPDHQPVRRKKKKKPLLWRELIKPKKQAQQVCACSVTVYCC